jgi:hypothetical protein
MSKSKKQWAAPQLVVLARGTPEESVLTHCKRIGAQTAALPYPTGQTGCDQATGTNCSNCQSRSGS